MYIVILVVYANYVLEQYTSDWAKKEFNSGLCDIILNNTNEDEMIKKLELLHRQFKNKHSSKIKEYGSLKSILEIIISELYCKKDKYLKSFNILELKDRKDLVIKILNKVEEEHPFSNLQNNQEWLLKTIKNMTKDSNNESEKYIFKQLENEIDRLNAIINKSEIQNRFGFIGTIVGIILTIVFGIASLK